ncbi:MAG: hypothetical protein HZB51_06685 [Chloroflexi bacterium]|nr:hypothetical protein [Chloroflexota bacterium]
MSLDGDLSLLLRDYVEHGATVLQRLDGVFGLVMYNGRTHILSIISDPFGYMSLFYGTRGNQTWISTSALAVAQQIQATPNELGVHCFLRTGKVFGEMTLWQEIKRLRPAMVLEQSVAGTRESTYWTPVIDASLSRMTLPDAVDKLAESVPALLQRNLSREGKVWSDLTGGFDTRFLTVLLENAGLPFKANFVGPDHHPDVKIAKQIIRQTGWEHQQFQLPRSWAQDSLQLLEEALYGGDGHLNVLLLLRPLWVHHREREQFGTLLNGLGGEMWRGPNWWTERTAIGESTSVHYERQLWALMHPIAEQVLVSNSKRMVEDELLRQFRIVGERCPDAPNTFKLDSVWAYRETGHVGAFTSCAAGLLRVIPPLFSKDIVDLVMSFDYRWRVNNALVKHWLFRTNRAIANLQVEGRGPAAPLRIDNWYRFIPSRFTYAYRAIDKLSQVGLGRSIRGHARPEGYSRLEFRQELIQWAANKHLLDPAQMHSGKLYHSNQLAAFLQEAQTEKFKQDEFLGRIITVEMALRETGAVLQPKSI